MRHSPPRQGILVASVNVTLVCGGQEPLSGCAYEVSSMRSAHRAHMCRLHRSRSATTTQCVSHCTCALRSCSRYPNELSQEGLWSFYHEVDRLAAAAPQLRSLRVSVRGYASQP